MDRSTGIMTRATNGAATSACAIGISAGDARRSKGGRSSAIRKPKPIVTAETPSGRSNSVSRPPAARAPRRGPATANAASPPMTRAITVAIEANTTELRTASIGGTKTVLVRRSSDNAR